MQIMGVFEMSNEIKLKEKSDLIHSKIKGLKLNSGGSLIRTDTLSPDEYTEEYKHYYEYERSEKCIAKIRVHVDEKKIVVEIDSLTVAIDCPVKVCLDTKEAVNYIESFLNSM